MSEDFLDQFETEKDHDRSLFLSSLCILTWIGGWFTVLYYGLHVLKISDIEDSIYHYEQWEMEYNLMKVSIVAPMISMVGAFYMWRLRKFGFWIYLAGQLAQCAFGIYVYVFVKDIELPLTYYFLLYYAIALSFIALYALNWKLLK